jgi:hypothetical protein
MGKAVRNVYCRVNRLACLDDPGLWKSVMGRGEKEGNKGDNRKPVTFVFDMGPILDALRHKLS